MITLRRITIKSLIKKATLNLKKQKYSRRCYKYITSTWRQFQNFCDSKGATNYSTLLKEEFISELEKAKPTFKQSTIKRKTQSMKMLDLTYTRGTWKKGTLNPLSELSQESKDYLEQQDKYLLKTNHSECSRLTMRKHISTVLRYFHSIGMTRLSEIDETYISSYVLTLKGHAKSTIRGELSRFRIFLSYLYLMGYLENDLRHFVPKYHLGGSQSMVKIWKSEELQTVLETVDRSSVRGKRDYAFILIAAELGVRSKDICELKISDFDWEACSISFIQSKTQKANILPLNEKVGLAVIDYLQVRPKTNHNYLFVSLNPPYNKMTSFNSTFHRYIARSGVKVPVNAHHGLHSLRATVATRLLSADVSPDVIFSFLGHSDRNSLDHYIRLDIENLRECALSFEDGELI